MKDYKPIPNKKYKVLPSKNHIIIMECLCALNYRRFIKFTQELNRNIMVVKLISQLNDGKLFYYKRYHSQEWAWEDEAHYNYLVELSENYYSDKTNILPEGSIYNILKQNSDDIVWLLV